ncbi:unnamed protein product [Eruca vesicaria subsp. sativa]|uniref:Uncharacterized protein n=1 Tax=Eruca vesicaria subsp. sativa TaxID=29727 RepID=A0ABC8JRC9_ERUVS|nr:unnamed protein product [Eruca vesicaria subsp. sativa]
MCVSVFSRLKTRNQEWYFYCSLDKKYGNNSARMSRSTNIGSRYWNLGIKYENVTYTSDYFPDLENKAEKLMRGG